MSVPSLQHLRGLLIDLDGVVFTGAEAIPGSARFLADARTHGLPFLLVTNNSTASPVRVAERLAGMGIDVRPEEILTSADAAAAYVAEHGLGERVYVVGEAGLRQAVEDQGLTLADDGDSADCVLTGLDRAFDYDKLARATRAIRRGARFVATNTDALLPIEGGDVLPGAGTMVGAIQIATAVEPIVVGKPERGLFERGLERLGHLPPHDAAMVGDRIDTDIDGGHRAGLRTILVLSGVTTADQATVGAAHADAVVANLAALPDLLGW